MEHNQGKKAANRHNTSPKAALRFGGLYQQLSEHFHVINGFGNMRSHLISLLFVVSVSLFHGLDCLRCLVIPRKNRYTRSVAHFYLSCRQSLPFFNNFPITLMRNVSSEDFINDLANWLCKVRQAVSQDAEIARAFSTCRMPGRFCDRLFTPESSDYFAILHAGYVIRVPLNYCSNPLMLSALLQEILCCKPGEIKGITISECASYHRRGWSKMHKSLRRQDNSALQTLQHSHFILCLDRPEEIEVAKGARFAHLHNRFCDKSIQICVDLGSGHLMLLCEHASVDAMAANHLIDRLANEYLTPANIGGVKSLSAPIYFSNDDDGACCNTLGRVRVHEYLAQLRDMFDCASGQVEGLVTEDLRSLGVSADLVVQLAIYEAFRACTGRSASMYEPVALKTLSGRRLDFINPVSEAVTAFQRCTTQRQRLTCLQKATSVHHAQITRAKYGQGILSHLLNITHFVSLGGAFNAINQSFIRWLLLTTMPAARFIYKRDIMASNGIKNPEVALFGTLCHQPRMVGVGYLIGRQRVIIDVVSSHATPGGILPHQFIKHIEANIRSMIDVVNAYHNEAII